jgi:hypothetical protein
MGSAIMTIEYNGETHTVQEWAQIKGITANALTLRIARGWTPEEALNTPVSASHGTDPSKKKTKEDAERLLNETPIEKVSSMIAPFLLGFKSKRLGTMLRRFNRPLFDRWYREEFLGRGSA